uniref:Uncharacterized protein n=2 Tax=Strombidium rassoulzadegani TaxID=1082188 RepID=A0A7S3FX68_9SPIT|mmetsp:Transcript_3140/g.5250  ORF Transcript_3140/g.5250 Transcript_3140/m.5250 type:complete len:170 (+) Transcript_3140:145-654(+)
MYTLTLVCNIVVVSIYWSILHPEQMEEYKAPDLWGKRFHLRIVHSIPFLVCFANAAISRVKLKHQFWRVVPSFCLLYGTFVYYVWLSRGIQQYSFLDFRQAHQAFTRIILICALGSAAYEVVYKLELLVKPDLCSRYYQARVRYQRELTRNFQKQPFEVAMTEQALSRS